MPAINQLNSVDTLGDGDLLPVFSQQNGDARAVSVANLRSAMQSGDEPGILGLSSIFALRKTTQQVVALTTSFQNIAAYDATLTTPSGRTALSASTVIGEFVATRDIQHVMIFCTMSGSWPSNRDLTLSVLIGTDAAPYESSFKFVGAGRGAGNPLTASFSGPGANLNNGGNIIRSGEKIRLVAKFNTADNLTIDRLAFVVQTLDGI